MLQDMRLADTSFAFFSFFFDLGSEESSYRLLLLHWTKLYAIRAADAAVAYAVPLNHATS